MEQKTEKTFFIFKTLAFEYETTNSHNPEEDASNLLSLS